MLHSLAVRPDQALRPGPYPSFIACPLGYTSRNSCGISRLLLYPRGYGTLGTIRDTQWGMPRSDHDEARRAALCAIEAAHWWRETTMPTVLARIWVPTVTVVAVALGTAAVTELRGAFGSEPIFT